MLESISFPRNRCYFTWCARIGTQCATCVFTFKAFDVTLKIIEILNILTLLFVDHLMCLKGVWIHVGVIHLGSHSRLFFDYLYDIG